MRRIALVLVGVAALWVPASAGATVSVSSDSTDLVSVNGDSGANLIHFTDGAHSSDGTDFATEVWDASGTPVSAGSGCFTAPDNRDGQNVTAAYCGASSGASIVVHGGAGDDTLFYDVNEYLGSDERTPASLTADGGDGNDTIDFTLFNTVTIDALIEGGTGDDKVRGGVGNLVANLGDGTDEFDGGSGDDAVHGDAGDDQINGGAGKDVLFGDAGNDNVAGNRDDDKVTGGPGRDILSGDGDTAYTGNDEIFAVDGEKDIVSCDLGADVAHVDAIDTVESADQCEDIERTGAGSQTKAGPSVGGASVSVAVPKALKRSKLVGRGIKVTIASDTKLAGGVGLAIDGRTAKRLGLGKKTVTLGLKVGVVSSSSSFTVKPKAKYRSKLKHAHRFTLFIIVVVRDAAGHQATKQYAVRVT